MTAGEEPSFSVLEADTLTKSRADTLKAIEAYFDFKKTVYDKVWNTELLATGVIPAQTFIVGTREKQILTIDDFKGLKLRAPNPRAGDLFEALGAAPQFMKKTELYMALKTGVVDGFGSGYGSLHAEKFHEVMKYVTWVGTPAATQEDIVVSRNVWNKLPDDLKKIMREVYAEWAERTKKDSLSGRVDTEDKAALEAAGIITAELSAADRATVQELQAQLVKAYVESEGGRVAEAWQIIGTIIMK